MNSKALASLITAALVGAPLAANAASMTFDFTGTVTSSSGSYAQTAGTPVTGTIYINTTNWTSTYGTVGSQNSTWESGNNSGGGIGANGSYSLAISDTAAGGTFVSESQSSGTWLVYGSDVRNLNSPPYEIEGSELVINPENDFGFGSSFTINNNGAAAAYDTNGFPLPFATPVAGSSDSGYAYANGADGFAELDFSITSLTAAPAPAPATVPLPAAAWLMLSGLGGLWLLGRRGGNYSS